MALKQVQESTSAVPPEAAASAGLSALQSTRAQLRAAQIQLAALLTAETEQNPEVVRLRSQIAGLAGQLNTLQKGEDSALNGTPMARVPAQTLEYTRRLHARLRVIPGCGHLLIGERPDACRDAIEVFLRDCGLEGHHLPV